jgi:hypothetical protein
MMTIGDVLGIEGVLLGLGICAWAVMIATAILFPARASAAKESIEASPLGTVILGLAVTLFFAILGLAMSGSPHPLIKILGLFALTGTLAVGGVGSGGVALIMGERVRTLQPEMNPYQAFCRGSAILFLCSLTPILGTFLIAPATLAVSVGAGCKAIFRREAQSTLAQP